MSQLSPFATWLTLLLPVKFCLQISIGLMLSPLRSRACTWEHQRSTQEPLLNKSRKHYGVRVWTEVVASLQAVGGFPEYENLSIPSLAASL